MLRTYRAKVLVLLLLAGGLAAGAVVWQATTRTTSGTIGGGNVFTSANNAADCIKQARAFTDYPLVWAGPSVLGYPLVYCAHSMTKTRYTPDGQLWHPGGDSWAFGYGTCTTPKGAESCALPITIIIDPCALTVDGRTIPKASQPVRSMTVRGAQADISRDGVLTFEQSPQMIQIYAPEGVPADERAANAVKIAEALVPANPLGDALSRGAPLTAAFAAAPDTLCRNSFVPAPPAPDSPSASCCSLQLDMDPATPGIQATRTVSGQQDISIDVVLGDTVGELGGFNFSLIYDDTRLTPVTPGATGINGNPDFNDAALGAGWNCSMPGTSGLADIDAATGAGHGVAFLSCFVTGAPPSVSTATVIATLQLRVTATGPSDIAIADANFAHYDATEIGSCNPVVNVELTCAGGSVTRN